VFFNTKGLHKGEDMKRTTLKLLVLLAMLIGLWSTACTGGTITTTNDYNVSPSHDMIVPIDLKNGGLLEVSVTVRGGTDLDIGFSVQDPDGRDVVASQRVHSQDFTVKAKQDGRYEIVLDNSYSLFTGKIVTLVLKYPK